LTNNLSLGAEYRYTDYGKFDHAAQSAAPGLASEQATKTHTVRASLAYKFRAGVVRGA
jgi:outer membrane immunogenic protein